MCLVPSKWGTVTPWNEVNLVSLKMFALVIFVPFAKGDGKGGGGEKRKGGGGEKRKGGGGEKPFFFFSFFTVEK